MAVKKRHDVGDEAEEQVKVKAKPRSKPAAQKAEETPEKGVKIGDAVVSEPKLHEDLESLADVPSVDAPPVGDGFNDTFVPGRIAPDYPVNANPDEILAGRQTKKQAADAARGSKIKGDNAV